MGMSSEVLTFILAARDNASGTVKKVGTELNTLGGAGAKAAGPLGKLSAVTGGLVSPATLAIGATAAVTAGLAAATNAASDNSEAVNKLRVVYGDDAAALETWARSASKNLGASNTAALEALGTFGNLFTAMGVGRGDASAMSQDLVQLAADLGSFNNIDPSEVFVKLRAGLVGETEPLRTLGINISAVRTEAKALELGLYSGVGAISAAAKAQANYAIILEDSKNAQGDYARTSDGLANRQRTLSAMVEDLAVKIGQIALPAITEFVGFLIDDGIPALEWFAEQMGVVGHGVENAVNAFKEAAGDVHFFAMNFGEQGDRVHRVAEQMGLDFDELKDKIRDRMVETGEDFETAADRIEGKWRQSSARLESETQKRMTAIAARTRIGGAAVTHEFERLASQNVSIMDEAAVEFRNSAYQSQVEYAKGLIDGRDGVKVQMDALRELQKTEMTRTEEIAYLKGQLTSKRLEQGLASQDRVVAAQARATQSLIRDQLAALGVDAYGWGAEIPAELSRAMKNGLPLVINAAGDLAAGIRGQVGIESEPRDPRSPLRGITKWGGNAARTWAQGFQSEASRIRADISAGANLLAQPSAAPSGGGAGGSGGLTVIFQSTFAPAPGQAEDLARQLMPAWERERRRQGLAN